MIYESDELKEEFRGDYVLLVELSLSGFKFMTVPLSDFNSDNGFIRVYKGFNRLVEEELLRRERITTFGLDSKLVLPAIFDETFNNF